MGSLHNIDFGVFWARWGGSGKEPGSGYRFRELWEPVLGTGSGFRWVPTGFAVLGSGSEGYVKEVSKVSVFDGFRGVRFCSRGFDETVSGNRVPGTRGIKKVPGQGFRQLLCTSKVYSFTLKVYFCTLKVCFCTLKVSFCNLKVHSCTLKVYFESMLLYFDNILWYFQSALLDVESILVVLCKYTLVLCHNA